MQATKERILDALVRAMANGLATLSIPAVAAEAGVSTQTIYRHFGSKAGLLEALGPYVTSKARLFPDPLPDTIDDEATIRAMYEHLEELDDTLRAAMASELGQQVRQSLMPMRRSIHATLVRRSAPGLSDTDLERMTDLSVALTSSGTYRVFKDYLGLSVEEAAERTSWALRMLLRGASVSASRQSKDGQ